MSIFRPEVLESQRTSWVGEIRLIRPLSLTVLTSAVVAAAVGLGAFLYFGEYTRKVRVAGVLVPIALQVLELRHTIPHTVLPAVLVLAGGYTLRWVMVNAGQVSELVAVGMKP